MLVLFNAATEGGADVILGACTPAVAAISAKARETATAVTFASAIEGPAAACDLIVLAQASMARVVPVAESRVCVPVLSSVRPALARVRQLLGT